MKRLYWQALGVPGSASISVTLVALAGFVLVEAFPVQRKQPFYEEKIAAARRAREALAVIKTERIRRGIPIDPASDPADSGLIGHPLTPVTSNTGYLDAKQITVNPNFAAVILHMLKGAHLEKGDVVAVGVSGSFPALNVATYAAVHVLGLKPIIITSTAASEWGANEPSYMWPDMEHVLQDKHVFPFRSIAASLGGIDDRGFGMSQEGRAALTLAIERNELPRVDSKSVADAIQRRMAIYEREARNRPIKAYVNVGGGSASVGTHIGKKQLEPGVNLEPPQEATLMDSVMLRFLARDVPVIHVTQIKRLARAHGLPRRPGTIPRIGEGTVYVRPEYNRWLAALALAVIAAVLFAFVRSGAARLLARSEGEGEARTNAG
jgi:poly-gamma-glutamate system protein